MLSKLALQNFKAWEKCAIDLGRITVLIGPNGSGKSSLLQALGLLKQSRNQESLVWNGPYESLGRFEDVVSHRDLQRRIEFQIWLENEVPPDLEEISGRFECHYCYSLDAYGPVEHKTEYRFQRGRSITSSYDFQESQGTIDTFPKGLLAPMVSAPGSVVAVPFHGRATRETLNSIRTLRDTIRNQLDSAFVVKTQRIINEGAYPSKSVGLGFAEAGDVANFIAYSDEPRLLLSEWLSQIFDDDVELSARFLSDSQVALELRREKESTNVIHEGAGIQNIIWPLAQIAAAPSGALIAVEEPEVHLHPKAQAQVGQVLTEIARTEDKQILVTSQSEHILMSFLTEAVKSGASPDDFRVYYCTSHNRVAEIEELRLDPNKGLDGGLKGFFEAGFDETQRYLEALIARNSG